MRMLLVLTNLYDPSMPSWPEVMSVYGKHLPARGHKVDWDCLCAPPCGGR